MADNGDRDYTGIPDDLVDSLDEEFEIELEDRFEFVRRIRNRRPDMLDRRSYFRELRRLQRELIKVSSRSPSC